MSIRKPPIIWKKSIELGRSVNRAPCQKCQFYRATWDKKRPHACRLFGFKSYLLPALEIYRSTGVHCPAGSAAKWPATPANKGSSQVGNEEGILA